MQAIKSDENLELQPNDVFVQKKSDTAVINSDGNTYEIVVISENFEEEKAAPPDAEFEEYELLEVDHLDANTDSLELEGFKQLQSEVTLMNAHDDNESTENEPENSYHINTRQKQRRSNAAQVEKQNSNIKERARGMAKSQLTALASSARRPTEIYKEMKRKKYLEVEQMEQDCEEIAEGTSDNEFPSRDSDDEDWPQTLGEFPTEIIKDGLLLVKGKQLMSIICRYKIQTIGIQIHSANDSANFSDFIIWNADNVIEK